jgi:hypothetical protein
MENSVQDKDSIIVFSKKYVIHTEQLEECMLKKLTSFFEAEMAPYNELIRLLNSLRLVLFATKD